MTKLVLKSYRFPAETIEQIKWLARRRRIPATLAIRQAIANEVRLQKMVDAEDKILHESGGTMRELVIVSCL